MEWSDDHWGSCNLGCKARAIQSSTSAHDTALPPKRQQPLTAHLPHPQGGGGSHAAPGPPPHGVTIIAPGIQGQKSSPPKQRLAASPRALVIAAVTERPYDSLSRGPKLGALMTQHALVTCMGIRVLPQLRGGRWHPDVFKQAIRKPFAQK
ncbi:hypothetical protein H4Q26_010591 [Puccinia striiformis f. sp. tritici PST-130]|nr:hypothetical protein H4Q26_010591 [Puccinia striiformis f. sp. tritici PST-130]